MSKLEAKDLVPELRFSGFDKDWELKKLSDSDVAMFVKERTRLTNLDIKTYVSTENLLPDYSGIGRASKLPPSGSFTSYKPNDILVSNIRPYLKKVWYADKTGAASNDIIVIRPSDNINSLFLLSVVKNDKFINYVMKGAKGVKMPRGDITSIQSYPVPVPNSIEQQKIADCLSSMDDLITANTRKLETLKSYKKGLMQQLFPSEGKSVPELRFSGFEEEWKEVELNKLGYLVSGLTYSPDDVQDSGLLVLRSSNVQNGQICCKDSVFVSPNIKSANLSQPNDILVCVRNGSKGLIGKNALIPNGIPLSTHGAFMTVFRSEQAKFVFQLFQTFIYQKQVEADLGATINSINGKQFLKYIFDIPQDNNEKNKIVDVLFSLDDLINVQSKKIETLKNHKKGLMQRLFPVVEALV